jgi:benzoyl-CoA reductase/2-hydroxyglutaryl-CoA dehydratase subunit BcrC/BadD/HgdB
VQEPYVVTSWPSVPVEILRATGFRPVIARGAADPTPAADAHLEPRIFPRRLRRLVEQALTGCLSSAARIIIPRTSDADYKCFLYLREFVRRGISTAVPPTVLFDLLQSGGSDVRDYDVTRTRALLDGLASVSGRMPSADDLRREITRANAARAAAARLVALRRVVPRVSGTEVFPLLAAFWEMEPDRYVEMAYEAANGIAARPPLSGPRVLLTGAPVDGSTLHEAIESHGAIVVAEVGPWGSGVAGDDVRVDDDPGAALADKYRADSLGARAPVESLRRWTERMLDDVDAVVVSLPPDDAVFGWDYPALRHRLEARGLPHACLRLDPYEPPTAADHAALDGMVSAASLRQEAPRG